MHDATGPLGESIASDFLRAKGCKIIEKNFRTQLGEIDIIARTQTTLVFVEVKTLVRGAGFEPELHFTAQKMQKMQRTIRAYLKQKRALETDYRLDLIAVELNPDDSVKALRHYENITA